MEKNQSNKRLKDKKKPEDKTIAQIGKRTGEPTRILAMAGRYQNKLLFLLDNDSLYELVEEYQNYTRTTI